MMRLKYVMVIPLKNIVAVIFSRGLVYSSIGVRNFMEAYTSTRMIQLWAGGHETLAVNEIVSNTY